MTERKEKHKQKFNERGITLIALVITIIVLLILAGVALSALTGDSGILNNAESAKRKTNLANKKEQLELAVQGALIKAYAQGSKTITRDNLEEELDNIVGKINKDYTLSGDESPWTLKVGEYEVFISENANIVEAFPKTALTDSMLTKTVNSDLNDKYNNKITVPAGFKILVDDTTGYTAETIDVTKGIVITDGKNEFVWVPVGKIYTNIDRTEYKTIELNRYTFASDGTPNPIGDAIIEDDCQELATSEYGNATAKDLQEFINSANKKGGYYLARYEAGVINFRSLTDNNANNEISWTGFTAKEGEELELVSRYNERVWTHVTQNKAAELSRDMYKEATTFTSDLINSYAWDTAIVFIQTFGGCTDYSMKNLGGGTQNTGITGDKYCNIYDMSGNTSEWSTETSCNEETPCVLKGGYYSNYVGLNTRKNYYTTKSYYDTFFQELCVSPPFICDTVTCKKQASYKTKYLSKVISASIKKEKIAFSKLIIDIFKLLTNSQHLSTDAGCLTYLSYVRKWTCKKYNKS